MRHIARAVALALLLTGCSTYSLVEPRRTAIGDLYTVEPQIAWSAVRMGKMEIWTVDGPSLQELAFIKGLRDGEPLVEGKARDKRPQFKKNMTASDLMEFVVDSVSMMGGQQIAAKNLRPIPFGNVPGFRFDLSFSTQEGLEKDAVVAGAIVKDRLYLIHYSGTRAYYYPKYQAHVEQIIDSIRMQ